MSQLLFRGMAADRPLHRAVWHLGPFASFSLLRVLGRARSPGETFGFNVKLRRPEIVLVSFLSNWQVVPETRTPNPPTRKTLVSARLPTSRLSLPRRKAPARREPPWHQRRSADDSEPGKRSRFLQCPTCPQPFLINGVLELMIVL